MFEEMAYLQIAALMLLAAGAVLFIKITRRRQKPLARDMEAVPTDPMSRKTVQRLEYRYLVTVAVLIGLLFLLGIFVFAL